MFVSSELENLIAYYHEKKLAHAYLISTNNVQKCHEVLINVIKNIFCVQEYSDNCNKCSLCHLIDLNNLPSLKVIVPDGSFIKKEQILELKHLFSRDSQYTKDSIYIIENAEKMNKESANTMLKFLEEPEGNVIGFFITNNKDNVMLTIKSRCQIIECDFENTVNEEYNLSECEYQEHLDLLEKYLKNVENNAKESILNNEILRDLEKDDIKKNLQLCLAIYQKELNSRFNSDIIKEERFSFLNNLSINNLKKKVKLLINLLTEMQYNVNVNLLLDKMVLEMEGINNETL